MTVVPAQAAGVKEIAVVAPPTKFGADNPDVLATCHELGVTRSCMGRPSGWGVGLWVEGVPRVDKIVGPGNLFVALAKSRSMARSTSIRSRGRAKWS
ncbi:MAG: histidinol dehydrogenase [Pirellulaceae bacterium]